jgi:hypothetical protein
MVRADPAEAERWLDDDGDRGLVQPMEMRGRRLGGWLLVAADGLTTDDQLRVWVDRGAAFVRTLPPK